MAREIAFVPETLTLDRLLQRMRTERFHLAAVIDEYGGVSGIVTLEDVIEEIVGAIQDEFDVEKPRAVAEGRGVYEVSGGMLVEDLEEALGIELSERDEDTIGGVVLSELGRNPADGRRRRAGTGDDRGPGGPAQPGQHRARDRAPARDGAARRDSLKSSYLPIGCSIAARAASTRWEICTGLARWAKKPAARARWASSARPKPVTAMAGTPEVRGRDRSSRSSS